MLGSLLTSQSPWQGMSPEANTSYSCYPTPTLVRTLFLAPVVTKQERDKANTDLMAFELGDKTLELDRQHSLGWPLLLGLYQNILSSCFLFVCSEVGIRVPDWASVHTKAANLPPRSLKFHSEGK